MKSKQPAKSAAPKPAASTTVAKSSLGTSLQDVRAALIALVVAGGRIAGCKAKIDDVPEWAIKVAHLYLKASGIDILCKPIGKFTPYEMGRFVGYWELQTPISKSEPDAILEEVNALCDTVRERLIHAKPARAIKFHEGRADAEKYAIAVERSKTLRWMLDNQSQVAKCRKAADLSKMLQNSGEVITTTRVEAIESFARTVRELWNELGLASAAQPAN